MTVTGEGKRLRGFDLAAMLACCKTWTGVAASVSRVSGLWSNTEPRYYSVRCRTESRFELLRTKREETMAIGGVVHAMSMVFALCLGIRPKYLVQEFPLVGFAQRGFWLM